MQYSDNELIRLIQTNPDDPMVDLGMHTLLIKHNPLLIHCAHKFSFKAIPFEDRYIACQMAFCEAIKTLDLTKGALTTWVTWKCRAALTALKREEYPWMEQDVPVPQYVDVDDPFNEGVMNDYVADPIGTLRILEQTDLRGLFRVALTGLSERDVGIYCHYHGILDHEELNGSELADRFSVTPTRITQILKSVGSLLEKRILDNYDRNEVI